MLYLTSVVLVVVWGYIGGIGVLDSACLALKLVVGSYRILILVEMIPSLEKGL